MKLSAKSAMKTRQESRKLGGFSQMWKSGDTVQVYYPLVWENDEGEEVKAGEGDLGILAAAEWGHQVDPKEIGLKRIFIPTLSEVVDGDPITPDITYQFSRIAPLFRQGAYDKQIADLMAKDMTEPMRRAAIKKIDEQFEKGQPVIGKLKLIISTECVAVPLLPSGEPDVEKARLVTQDLSDKKIMALQNLLQKAAFAPLNGEMYLEVSYSFGTSGTRSQDGQVAPNGMTPEERLSAKYPDQFLKIKQLLEGLPESSETILKRNSSFRKVEESEIMQALSTFSVLQSDSLLYLEEETNIQRLAKNAAVLVTLQVPVKGQKDEVLDAIEEEKANRQKLKELAAEAAQQGAPIPGDEQAPTMTDLYKDHQADVASAKEEAKEDRVDGDRAYQEEAPTSEGTEPGIGANWNL